VPPIDMPLLVADVRCSFGPRASYSRKRAKPSTGSRSVCSVFSIWLMSA
jgi:hypothetical protein